MKNTQKSWFSLIFTLLTSSSICLAQQHQVKMKSTELTTNMNSTGVFSYQLKYKDKPVLLNSSIGFELSKPNVLLNRFDVIKIDSSSVDQFWVPVWGEQDSIRNHYKELVYHLRDKGSSKIEINLIFRVFEDGIGFRYAFPKQEALDYFIVQNELTEFNLGKDHTAFWIPGDFDTDEYLYNTTKLSEVDALKAAAKEKDIAVTSLVNDHTIQSPLMLKTEDELYINIHEAALLNYPAMHLDLNKNNFNFSKM